MKRRIAKEIAEKINRKTPGFMQRATEATIGKVPGLRALPKMVQQKIISRRSYCWSFYIS